MSVKIRLKRVGRRNRPCYRVGVFDTRTPRGGRCIENLGSYDPLNSDKDKQFVVDAERLAHWVARGAKPSDTVASLVKKLGIGKDAPAAPDAEPAQATQ